MLLPNKKNMGIFSFPYTHPLQLTECDMWDLQRTYLPVSDADDGPELSEDDGDADDGDGDGVHLALGSDSSPCNYTLVGPFCPTPNRSSCGDARGSLPEEKSQLSEKPGNGNSKSE